MTVIGHVCRKMVSIIFAVLWRKQAAAFVRFLNSQWSPCVSPPRGRGVNELFILIHRQRFGE